MNRTSYKKYGQIVGLYGRTVINTLSDEYKKKENENRCLILKNIYGPGNRHFTENLCYKPIIFPSVNYDYSQVRSPCD